MASPSPLPTAFGVGTGVGGDVDEAELAEPFVDIEALFAEYNCKYFGGRVRNTRIEYSSRMTSCAGTCTYMGARGCRIALSEPLLKFRPRRDLLSTVLHEMVHAYLFVTEGVSVRDGVDGHGPKFLAHAERINEAERGAVCITPYHTFAAEVEVYRTHHWKCVVCNMLVKRQMNRAPAPRDLWWPKHEQECGGAFVKVREPEPKPRAPPRAPKNRAVAIAEGSPVAKGRIAKGIMRTRRIDEMLAGKLPVIAHSSLAPTAQCPICNAPIVRADMNAHLDICLTADMFTDETEGSRGQDASKSDPILIPESEDVPDIPSDSESDRGVNQESAIQAPIHIPPLTSAPESRPTAAPSNAPVKRRSRTIPPPAAQSDVVIVDVDECQPVGIPRNVSTTASLPPNERSRAAKSNVVSMRDAVEGFFSGPEVLMDCVLRDAPLAKPRQALKSRIKPRSSLDRIASAAQKYPTSPVKSLAWSKSPHELSVQVAEALHPRDLESFSAAANEPLLSNAGKAHNISDDELFEFLRLNSRVQGGRAYLSDAAFHMLFNHRDNSGIARHYRQPQPATVSHIKGDPSTRQEKTGDLTHLTQKRRKVQDEARKQAPETAVQATVDRCPSCGVDCSCSTPEHGKACPFARVHSQVHTGVGDVVNVSASAGSAKQGQMQSGGVPDKDSGTTPCPVCNTAVQREALQGHIAVCMANSGLVDAFE